MEDRWREREERESVEVRSGISEGKSYKSYRSYGSMSIESSNTLDSVGLSDREIDKFRRMIFDKEKEERRENIVIKEVDTGE